MCDPSNTVACLGCDGRCCSIYLVPITGNDLWRIIQGQHLAPALFVKYEVERSPSDTGFLLRATGPTHALFLRHSTARRNERQCVFLMHLRDGVRRCGIYADRPLACQTYPMQWHEARVIVRSDAECPRGSWATLEREQPLWGHRLQQQDATWQQYSEVVSYWNTMVRTSDPQAGFALDDFLAYLVNAYDLIMNLPEDQIGERLATLAQSSVA